MSKKRKIKDVKPEELNGLEFRVIADQWDEIGGDDDPGDGTAYSGYSHEVRHVNFKQALIVPETYPGGYEHHSVWITRWNGSIPGNIGWDYSSSKVFIVVCRYRDGGTFGMTEGYWEVEAAFDCLREAEKWAEENRESIEKKHTHYFGGFEGLEIEELDFYREVGS